MSSYLEQRRAQMLFGKTTEKKEQPEISNDGTLTRLQQARIPKPVPEDKQPGSRSKKLSKAMRGYIVQVKIYLSKPENLVCKIQSPNCTKLATCVHHTAGRTGQQLKNEADWMPSCEACNGYVEENDAWARENGFKKTRLTKPTHIQKATVMEKEETAETVESIVQSSDTKAVKIVKLKTLGKSNKEIADLLQTNQGHVWNVLNKKSKGVDKIK